MQTLSPTLGLGEIQRLPLAESTNSHPHGGPVSPTLWVIVPPGVHVSAAAERAELPETGVTELVGPVVKWLNLASATRYQAKARMETTTSAATVPVLFLMAFSLWSVKLDLRQMRPPGAFLSAMGASALKRMLEEWT